MAIGDSQTETYGAGEIGAQGRDWRLDERVEKNSAIIFSRSLFYTLSTMSFASVSGSSIGQHLILPFSGNSSGIAMGAQQEVISLPIDKGVWIFNATFRVSTSNLSPAGSTLSADASVTFGSSVLARHHIDNQLSDDVNLVGVVFSDGTQDLTLTVSAFIVGAETATSWGYSDGKIDLVRLTQTY